MAPGADAALHNKMSRGLTVPGIRFAKSAKWILFILAFKIKPLRAEGELVATEECGTTYETWDERLNRLERKYSGGDYGGRQTAVYRDFSYKHEFWYNHEDGVVSLGHGHFIGGFILLIVGWLFALRAGTTPRYGAAGQ